MKYLVLIFAVLLISQHASAQMGARSIVPFSHAPAPAKISDRDPKRFTVLQTDKQNVTEAQKDSLRQADSLAKENAKFRVDSLPTFGLYGIGNTNTEAFNNVNSSGKLSGYIRPFKSFLGKMRIPAFIDVNFAFNVNASNTDSLLASTFLFPDVGKNSFSGTVVFNLALGKKPDFYLISPFFEFANKSIKGRNADSTRNFYTINSTVGVSFQYMLIQGKDIVAFSMSPYLASVHVPDPGRKDYKYLFTGNEETIMKTAVNSWGVKIVFQYNSFQIFADFRTVRGSAIDVPVETLRGFHPNIGIIFNAEIFQR